MKQVLRIAAIVALFSVPTIASAAESKEPFLVFGLSTESCGAFLQAMDGERKARPPGANPDAIYSHTYGGYLDYTDGF